MPKLRVFISSTFYDLRQIRDDLEAFVRDMGYESVRHETGAIPYGSESPLEEYAYREIESCDILVSVIGGRFGSPSAANPRESISQKELKRALEMGIPVFIFIEKKVHSEFSTFQINKELNINYRHVDNVRVYHFIQELYGLPCNNPISEFEVCSDIVDMLRAQWGGLFQRLLSNSRAHAEQSFLTRGGRRSMPATAVAELLARQILGQPIGLPEGIVDVKWAGGPSTLDFEVTNISAYEFDRLSLTLIEIHRWRDERPEFIESADIQKHGRFEPLTLHTQRLVEGSPYVSSLHPLSRDTRLTFLFLSLEDNCLRFAGQRGSSLGIYTIRTAGTWRVCIRTSLKGPMSGGAELGATTSMYFRWDGSTTPVPCDAPVAS